CRNSGMQFAGYHSPFELKRSQVLHDLGREGYGLERKRLTHGPSEAKADRAARTVSLNAAHFGSVDQGADLILKGAADESAEKDVANGHVKLFWNHEFALGPAHHLEPKGDYLFGAGKVSAHEMFDPYLVQVEDGTAGDASFGYVATDVDFVSGKAAEDRFGVSSRGFKRIRLIKRMRVFEVSPVLYGMNENAHVVGVKSAWAAGAFARPQVKDLWDLSSALSSIASLRHLLRHELSPEEAEIARAVIDRMAGDVSILRDELGLGDDEEKSSETNAAPIGDAGELKQLLSFARGLSAFGAGKG
ncbi:MAG: hypothetical protein AAFX50_13300, partial [Acidobacteriota bacterium]